jgi:hypothetical protein
MTMNDRTLSEADLDRVSGGLRDKPDQDRLNRQNRMDGGGWGAAIGGNLMMGGKMRTIHTRSGITYRLVLTDPDAPSNPMHRQGDRLRAVFCLAISRLTVAALAVYFEWGCAQVPGAAGRIEEPHSAPCGLTPRKPQPVAAFLSARSPN